MTAFIESFATQHLLPPWKSQEVENWVFALSLQPDGISWFINNYLNGAADVHKGLEPAPYHYAPIDGPQYAFLVVADQPGAQGATQQGHRVPNKNVYVTIPVRRQHVSPDNLVIDSGDFVWFRPIQWCDSSTFVFSAREVWGADVQYQTILRDSAVEALALHLDTAYVGCAVFEPASNNELLAALHVRAGVGAPADSTTWSAMNPQLRDLLQRLLGHEEKEVLRPPAAFPEAVGSIVIDSLKQFRAAEDMELATYRALVTSQQWHSQARDVVIHQADELQVDFLLSDTLSDLQLQFGLTPDKPPQFGVPGEHDPIRPPPPAEPGAVPTEVRWDLLRTPARAEFCMSFKSDMYFEVLDTLHVYGR